MSTIYVNSEKLARIEYRFFDAIPYKYEIRRVRKSTLTKALAAIKLAREDYKANGGIPGMYYVMTLHIENLEREIGA